MMAGDGMQGDVGPSPPLREQLILAGITEIENYGIRSFSLRRVAAACGVSCAAPYKHFADKQALIFAVLAYIHDRWHQIQKQIVARNPGDIRKTLVEISLAYIRFLFDNPQFRSVIMLRDDTITEDQRRMRSRMTDYSYDLVRRYCNQVGMPAGVALRKTYVVRSLIYGASLMLDNGELPNNDDSYRMIAQMIDREFDLE